MSLKPTRSTFIPLEKNWKHWKERYSDIRPDLIHMTSHINPVVPLRFNLRAEAALAIESGLRALEQDVEHLELRDVGGNKLTSDKGLGIHITDKPSLWQLTNAVYDVLAAEINHNAVGYLNQGQYDESKADLNILLTKLIGGSDEQLPYRVIGARHQMFMDAINAAFADTHAILAQQPGLIGARAI